MIQDLASLLWVVNLGCIDLNQWYARTDDVDRPDYLHFDLDPGAGASFERVLEAGLVVREALDTLKMPSVVKTTGSKGLHVYTPIVRGPVQKQVWTFAKALGQELASRHPELMTAEYRVANRPAGRVLVDYNQNAWGRTLASVYSVRPHPAAAGLDPGHVEGSRARHPHRGLHHEERAGARREARRPLEAPRSRCTWTLRSRSIYVDKSCCINCLRQKIASIDVFNYETRCAKSVHNVIYRHNC